MKLEDGDSKNVMVLSICIGESAMTHIPLVRQVTMAPAIAYLASEGIPVDRYLRRARLSTPSPGALEKLVPFHQVCDFLSSVARAEGIHDLGFRVTGQQGMEHLGVYGRLLAQALTLHDLIQTSRRLISSCNSGLRIWLERHQGQVRYCQKFAETLPQDQLTEVIHFGLASAMVISRYARGADWQPNRLELASGPVDLALHFPGLADLPVSFHQPHTSVWFDEALLSTPLPAFDTSHCPPADEKDRTSFVTSAPAADLAGQLEQAIESALGHSRMSLGLTAAIIGTSPRTLQRRLAERGSSFSHVHQGVRFRNAQRLLEDPRVPLTEIAKRLGYTDLANFIRAFKRWTGVGPNEYRWLHYEDDRQ